MSADRSDRSAQPRVYAISLSRTRLSSDSASCAKAAMRDSPRNADVPFTVWKARKTVLIASSSLGFASSCSSAASELVTHSLLSVMKSGSRSRSASSGS